MILNFIYQIRSNLSVNKVRYFHGFPIKLLRFLFEYMDFAIAYLSRILKLYTLEQIKLNAVVGLHKETKFTRRHEREAAVMNVTNLYCLVEKKITIQNLRQIKLLPATSSNKPLWKF